MDTEQNSVLRSIYQCFVEMSSFDCIGQTPILYLPIAPASTLKYLIRSVAQIFQIEPVMLNLSSPLIIVGDIHGHLLDLLRILATNGFPPQTNYLFLGDIVDRGEFSLESILLLFTMKLFYPNNVHIIRGNHEFTEVSQQFGFKTEISMVYTDSSIFEGFCSAFAQLPFSAVVDNQMVCLHGGPGPSLFSLIQLSTISRPVESFSSDFISSIVWSDPSDVTKGFQPSLRGTGYAYGENALNEFLTATNMKVLIRAHECVEGGIEEKMGGKVITVFSASNYCGSSGNKSGVLVISPDKPPEPRTYPPLQYILRNSVQFKKFADVSGTPAFAPVNRRHSFDGRLIPPLPPFGFQDKLLQAKVMSPNKVPIPRSASNFLKSLRHCGQAPKG